VWAVVFSLCIIFALLTSVTSYAIYLYRLVTTFKNSCFAIQRRTIVVHVVMLAACVLMQTVGMSGIIFGEYSLSTILMPTSLLLICIGIIHIVFVFNRNLFRTLSRQGDAVRNIQIDRLDVNDQELVDVITKQTLLASFPCVFIFCVIGVTCIAFAIHPDAGFVVSFWGLGLMLFASSYCHLVSFVEFKTLYGISCQRAHLCMSKCCDKLAKNKVSSSTSEIDLCDLPTRESKLEMGVVSISSTSQLPASPASTSIDPAVTI